MRQFRITVNGQSYDVTIEELLTDNQTVAAATPVEQKKPQTEHKQNITSPANPQPAPKPAATNGHAVKAPMPGAVLSVAVKKGQTVKAGEVLLILEAMKMENEINAPADGTINEVSVSQGTTVNTGDLLVVIE